MNLSFKGRVRNVSLPYTHALLPLFEAIINSVHAIEDAKTKGRVTIDIKRDTGGTEGFSTLRASGDIVGFGIRDNGIGFNAENFESFETSDSEYKKARGAKGVGRLMWLKAFSRVQVSSVYRNEKCFRRSFGFSIEHDGIHDHQHGECPQADSFTQVELQGFHPRYAKECPKRAETIADHIVEHCLFYFLDPTCPQIELVDESLNERVLVNEHFRKIVRGDIEKATIKIGNEYFQLQHIHLYSTDSAQHEAHLCGDRREVEKFRLVSRIPELRQKIVDTNGDHFTYYLYVSGASLDVAVNAERTGFDLPREGPIGLNGELSIEGILEAAIAEARKHLAAPLKAIQETVHRRVVSLVATSYPEHRQTLKYVEEYPGTFVPSMKDDEIALKLNEIQFREDIKTREEAKAIIESSAKDDATYQKQLEHYLSRMGEFRESRLVQYVIHRKCILEIMRKRLELKSDDTYERESEIHKVVFPLKHSSDSIDWNQQNLWLIDERLAYHHYLASDQPLSSTLTESESTKRPDLVVFDNPSIFNDTEEEVLSDVTIVEFKRPLRGTYRELKDYPPEQVYDYIREIEGQRVTSATGRPVIVHGGTRYHCYIICDITEPLLRYLDDHGFSGTPDKEVFYYYNKNLRAYVEIRSFGSLVRISEARNKVLFKTLGISP